MKTFHLAVTSASQQYEAEHVIHFVGSDASGSFGLLADAEAVLTVLPFGMVRFQTPDQHWHYLAVPEAVLHFSANRLTLTTSNFIIGDSRQHMVRLLEESERGKQSAVSGARLTIKQLDQALMHRFLQTGHEDE